MRILTRYLLRAHAGPFLFALTTLTGLLFLNSVAQRLEVLAGKGLRWPVIQEFLLLTLPHTVALSLPMAVLVAVLYAFSSLTASNEFTAMKAGGLRPQRLMVPLLVAGAIIGAVMFHFNDTLLPESNHRLRNLLNDIRKKSPTLVFREGVVNPIQTVGQGTSYYLSARTIDSQTNRMNDVAIYDVANPLAQRTIYASWATMAFNETRTDLYLTLHDGVTLETVPNEEGKFQQTRFERQVVPFRGVANVFEEGQAAQRGDREMTIAMLDSAKLGYLAEQEELRKRAYEESLNAVLAAIGKAPDAEVPRGAESRRSPVRSPSAAGFRPSAVVRDEEDTSGVLEMDTYTQSVVSAAKRNVQVSSAIDKQISAAMVEKHKKYTLAFACFVFVLLGGPLAIRFPNAGLGLVIAASSAIFAIYWAGLIGGESMADRRIAPAGLTMWIPNLIFSIIGIWLFSTMGHEVGSTRGSDWEETVYRLRRMLRSLVSRRGARRQPTPVAPGGGSG